MGPAPIVQKVESRERLGQTLVRHGLITEDDLAKSLDRQRRRGGLLGENLVALGLLDEGDLLKELASQFGTSYVSRKQVSESQVPKGFLDLVPLDLAEKHLVFPVWANKKNGEIVLLVSNPQDPQVLEQVRRATGSAIITQIFALPGTIRAAIERHYKGNQKAFDEDPEETRKPAASRPKTDNLKEVGKELRDAWIQDVARLFQLRQGSFSEAIARDREAKKPAASTLLVLEPDEKRLALVLSLLREEGHGPVGIRSLNDLHAALLRGGVSSILTTESTAAQFPHLRAEVERLSPRTQVNVVTTFTTGLAGSQDRFRKLVVSYYETMELMLNHLDLERGCQHPQGRSLPKIARMVASRLNLPIERIDEVMMAGYIREMTKDEIPHPSLLEVDWAARDGLAEEARLPMRILLQVGCPIDATACLLHVYERFDGTGAPDGLKGEEIPIGSRILATVSSFDRLVQGATSEDKDAIGRAIATLFEHSGTILDARVVHTLLEVFEKDLLMGEVDIDRYKVLFVDPDRALTDAVSPQLMKDGYRVLYAPTGHKAMEILRDYEPQLVVLEVHLPDMKGVDLARMISAGKPFLPVPFVFITNERDQRTMATALELGAEDYLIKFLGDKVILTKISRVLAHLGSTRGEERRFRGVSGSLSEMALADIVQVLATGGKSARVLLEQRGASGEVIVERGEVVDAGRGELRGEDAFYRMIGWSEGDFRIMPLGEVESHTIRSNYEALILEGMRRLDESRSRA